jgi:ankyrin repeat protein
VNISDNNGFTTICIAAQNGHMSVVRALIEYETGVNIANNDGITPVSIAAENDNMDVV